MYAVHDIPFSATQLLYYENKCSTDPHGQTVIPKRKNGKIMQKKKKKAKKVTVAWKYRAVSYYNEKSTITLEREKTYLNRHTRMIMALGS
jgi:hypothetical protein